MEILVIIKNFLKQSFNTKSKYIYFFAIPIVTFVAIFTLFGNTPSTYKVSLGIADNANNKISNLIYETLKSTETYRISYVDEKDIETELTRFDGILIIPSNYTGEEVLTIKVIKNPLLIKGIESSINRIINDYNNNSTQLTIKERTITTNDGLKYVSDRAMGFLLVFMFAQGLGVTALIIKNKENKTYYRLKTTPVKMSSYLIGNLIAAFLIVMAQVVVGLLVISNFFSFNIIQVLTILSLFAVVVVTIGLFVTSIAKTREFASNIATLLMTPTAMLGGCFWSVDLMPGFMQKISLFTPQYWTMKGLSQITSGDFAIGQSLLVLFAFSMLAGLFAIYNFKNSK